MASWYSKTKKKAKAKKKSSLAYADKKAAGIGTSIGYGINAGINAATGVKDSMGAGAAAISYGTQLGVSALEKPIGAAIEEAGIIVKRDPDFKVGTWISDQDLKDAKSEMMGQSKDAEEEFNASATSVSMMSEPWKRKTTTWVSPIDGQQYNMRTRSGLLAYDRYLDQVKSNNQGISMKTVASVPIPSALLAGKGVQVAVAGGLAAADQYSGPAKSVDPKQRIENLGSSRKDGARTSRGASSRRSGRGARQPTAEQLKMNTSAKNSFTSNNKQTLSEAIAEEHAQKELPSGRGGSFNRIDSLKDKFRKGGGSVAREAKEFSSKRGGGGTRTGSSSSSKSRKKGRKSTRS